MVVTVPYVLEWLLALQSTCLDLRYVRFSMLETWGKGCWKLLRFVKLSLQLGDDWLMCSMCFSLHKKVQAVYVVLGSAYYPELTCVTLQMYFHWSVRIECTDFGDIRYWHRRGLVQGVTSTQSQLSGLFTCEHCECCCPMHKNSLFHHNLSTWPTAVAKILKVLTICFFEHCPKHTHSAQIYMLNADDNGVLTRARKAWLTCNGSCLVHQGDMQRAKLQNLLCYDLSDACSTPAPKLPKVSVLKGSYFAPPAICP